MANLPGNSGTFAAKSASRDNVGDDNIEKNPMNICLVVANLCKYLNLQDLKVCRTLNRQWKEESEKFFWKSLPPLQLGPSLKNDAQMSISQYMEVFNDPHHNHPNAAILRRYQNFDVRAWYSFSEERVEPFYDFLSKVGPQMTSLRLIDLCVCRDLQDFYDILNSNYTPKLQYLCLVNVAKIPKLPTVTTMNLEDFPFNRTVRTQNENLRKLTISLSLRTFGKNITVPWLDVLSGYPNMKTLKIEGLNKNHFEEIATALVTVRINEKKFSLTKLNWAIFSRETWDPALTLPWGKLFNALKAANLPLKHFGIILQRKIDNEEPLISFLQSQSGTLKSLKLNTRLPHPFPLLENLEQFETPLHHPSDFRFLPQMPNLKSLRMDFDMGTRKPYVFPAVLVPNQLLTVFQSGWGWNWSVAELEQLFAIMPNIRILEMWLNNDTFSWVCKNLTRLKELTVVGRELDDSGVLGETMRMQDGVEVVEHRHGITNLKDLESFVMNPGSKLTEKSVFKGFSLMSRLSHLEMYAQHELSLAAKLALGTRIKTVKVILNSKFTFLEY